MKKVLIVDDSVVCLKFVSEKLKKLNAQIETANNGADVLTKIQSGEVYDLILMDYFMPNPDGLQLTTLLREMGYNGKIVMLTSDEIVSKVSETADGYRLFDGYLSKPIDLDELDRVLNKFLPGNPPPKILSRLKRAVERDAQRAIATINEAVKNDDIESLYITFHGMRSALANVGERAKSEMAYKLEAAAKTSDLKYINSRVPQFIQALESLKSDEDSDLMSPEGITNDEFMKYQLKTIKTACENYDSKSAYAAFDALLLGIDESSNAKSFIKELRHMLYSDSDFDGVSKKISEVLK